MSKLKIAQDLFDIIYPIGSVYLTINDVNPQTLFGGTWVKCSGGFIYGSTGTGTSGDNGNGSGTSVSSSGSGNTGSTSLSVSQIPSHNHSITIDSKSLVGDLDSLYGSSGISPIRDNAVLSGVFSINNNTRSSVPTYNSNASGRGLHIDVSHNHSASSGNTGSGSGHTHTLSNHSHTIPYFSCYIWKRTA